MNKTLTQEMAVRIADISKAMGLDDVDESLLWRYFACLREGDHLDESIADVLNNMAESDPVILVKCSWTASIPQRFAKRRPWPLSLFETNLSISGENVYSPPQVVTRIDSFVSVLEGWVKLDCFERNFEKITSIQRPDGVNWEPPTSEDVVVDIQYTAFSLRDRLRQFM